jgi:hypothetical protein
MDANCTAVVPGVSNPSRLDCAKEGMRALLNGLWPCPESLPTCGPATNGNVAQPLDAVGLMVFPGLKTTTDVNQQFDCAQNLTGGTGAGSEVQAYGGVPAPVYLTVPLSTDYRTAVSAGLNGSGSKLVKAVEWASGNSCTSNSYGLETPAGLGTYFADAIADAQDHLESNGRDEAQDVIILLGDGDANFAGVADPCQQAVNAAQAATAAGTWVYSIAYGATNGGCTLDSPSISSRTTMRNIASDSTKFFDQPGPGDLTTIFEHILVQLTTTRLVPDDTL